MPPNKKTGEYTLENVKEDQMITVSLTGGEYKDKNKDENPTQSLLRFPEPAKQNTFVTVLSAILIGAFVFITVIVFITVMRRKKTN